MDANWWNNALQSYDVGREHRADRENAQAFQDGGYGAVEQAAGRRGDLRTAMTTRRFQNEEQNQAFQWFEQNAPYARNVLRRARAIQDPQQRGAFLQSQRQRFEGMGFRPDQVDGAIQALVNPETAEEAFASYDAAFSQHEDPEWRLATVPTENGQGLEQRTIAIDPATGAIQRGEGALPVPRGEVQSFGSGGLYRENPNAPNGIEIIREPRSVAAGGGTSGGYRILSPEEAQQMGLPEGRTYQQSPRGQITPVGGATPMMAGAEQRGRLVLTFPNIIQAQEDLASLEANAVRRQGTHGSDTPLGQDWLARAAEAIPFDGGSAARMIGGEDYQAYETASRTFEQSVMPIFSGSAVTESEAVRFVRSNLPRMGDDRATLQRKAQNRARIINAAATILGEPPPYPEAGTWTPSGGLQRPQGQPGSPGAPAQQGGATDFVRDANGRIVPRR
jgi:hypothetical protein